MAVRESVKNPTTAAGIDALPPQQTTTRSPADSPSRDPQDRRGRRRSVAVGPPLIDTAESPTRSAKNAPTTTTSSSTFLSFASRPAWGIANWVMDLSMYVPPDEPSPVHSQNRSTWPRAFLDYDPSMDDATLVSRGEALADLVLEECSAQKQPPRGTKKQPVVSKTFDSARCLYVVHASVDIQASFDDVLAVLVDRTFLSHAFGHQLVSATHERRAGPTTSIESLHLHVPRGYKRQQAMGIRYLDHVRHEDNTLWTRVFKSIDLTTTASSSMSHVVCGFVLECLANKRHCRLSFYGDICMPSVLAIKVDGTNYFLDAFSQAVTLVQRIVRRRRRHAAATGHLSSDMPSRRVLGKRCRLCSKSFHLFRSSYACRICLSPVCADCSALETVHTNDDDDGLANDLRVCHACQSSPVSSPMTSPVVAASTFQPHACHVCHEPFLATTAVQCCKVCDQHGCLACGVFAEDNSVPPQQSHGAALWTCRRCIAPMRRSLSASHFSSMRGYDHNDDDLLRRASFD
ncbi:hypothetical protein AC1031_013016 [Aphanomyces cochlioides]|nr:hypothetical protein AC1031_013016 [Aphanomyces cochlioides]